MLLWTLSSSAWCITLQVRAGESVNNYEITRFAQLFNDELTLDNLERIQLVNLCRFVGIPPFGTDAFLASRLRAHLARIKVRPDLQRLSVILFLREAKYYTGLPRVHSVYASLEPWFSPFSSCSLIQLDFHSLIHSFVDSSVYVFVCLVSFVHSLSYT